MSFLQLQGVEKHFGEIRTIKGVDLSIERGQFTVFVGPSGCGKSTLLRLIAGLETLDGGKIVLDGRDITRLPSAHRDLAMVFQSYALYPHMTVAENMSFALRLAKADPAVIRKKVARAAEILNLGPYLERLPRALSGGQRQRVAIGRAIVREPKVFLFDEPLSNLDAKLRVEVRAEIKKLQARLQVTTVYVTHDQIEAMTMGHRIAILNAGKLQQVGAPLEVYEKPANLFAAGFIGTPPMNLIPATLGPGGSVAQANGFEIPVPPAARGSAGAGARVVMGIRPENVVPPGRDARGETHRLSLTVEIVEVLGDEVVIHGRAGESTLVFKQDPHRPAAVGSTIEVKVELEALHLFDAVDERRLGT